MNSNHKKFRKYSRDTQKLIFWLFQSYSNFQVGKEPNSKVPSYQTYKTKKDLKTLYLKHCEVKTSNLKPFNNIKDKLQGKILDVLKMDITDNNKVDIIYNDVENLIREEFQKLTLMLDGTFSLSLNLMSQKSANKFVDWLFGFMMDQDIPFRKEINELMKKEDNEKYIWNMIKRRKCAICGSVADLHHEERVNTLGGYSKDRGQGVYLPVCRLHHNEAHNTPVKEFNDKYIIKGIRITEEQAKELKKVYPNQFKAL